MRLAGHLGWSLQEIRDRMGSGEFSLWLESYFDRPFGDESRLLASMIATALNTAPFRAKDAKVWTADEILPKRPVSGPERQAIEQQKAMARALADLLGGKQYD